MPDRTVSILGYSCAALAAVYVVLVIVTVSLAAWQTDLAMAVHETEGDIGRIEAQYYDAVALIDSTNPGSLGLVTPRSVSYAVKAQMPALSLR